MPLFSLQFCWWYVILCKMKWKERVGIAIAVGLVLLTSVLVLDIRYAEHQHQEPMLRHGTNRLKSGKHFQRQFLNEEQHHQRQIEQQQQQQASVNGTDAEDQMDPATVSNPDDPLAMQRLVNTIIITVLLLPFQFVG